MINVLAKLIINEHQVPMFGKIDDDNRRIELYCQMTDLPAGVLGQDQYFYGKSFTISLIDTEAKAYSLYGVWFSQMQMAITGPGVMTLRGTFNRLIREKQPNQEYQYASFTFHEIEKLFPIDQFETHHTEKELIFEKKIKDPVEQQLNDSLCCDVQSTLIGTVEGDLFNLDLLQTQRIWLRSNVRRTVDEWTEIIDKVKAYLEFVLNQEIGVEDVILGQAERHSGSTARLIADPILIPKSYLKEVKDNPYRGTSEELLSGLAGWYQGFDEYQRAIEIWQKTIYNLNVSAEDLFLWRAQAFELLCTINQEIHNKAVSLRAEKQAFPNLKNNLIAAIDELGLGNIDEAYYSDAKNVRDYFTHNNPDKEVDDRQKKNSYKLMDHYLRKSMAVIFGVKGLSYAFWLEPPTEGNNNSK